MTLVIDCDNIVYEVKDVIIRNKAPKYQVGDMFIDANGVEDGGGGFIVFIHEF